ncbi:MAG: xanthine dehydrogenase family protein molybdopterin-binding subunit [Gemmatimonadetes bacterium]|nr:xanthine dehydrogenase family protein molybdopterin-binding subunit [Gemmatimonadota bacterium]
MSASWVGGGVPTSPLSTSSLGVGTPTSPSAAPRQTPSQSVPQLAPMRTVGHGVPRIDAVERVTGQAGYTRDLRREGMLFARLLTSPHPHARIVSIDTSRAVALPGVRAIVSHFTHPDIVYSSGSIAGGAQYNDTAKDNTLHKRYMFGNPVRYVGEPVAAVAAVDRHAAEEAARLITVEYEELPFVLDVEEALAPGAPQIWPEGNIGLNGQNQPRPLGGRQGDPEAGFAAAHRILEGRYTTSFAQDAQLEPRSVLAEWEGDKLILHTPTQGISNCRHDNARDLGLEDHQVQVICHYMGGGFGDKNGSYYHDLIAATLARETSTPVKLEVTRKEDWLGTHGRWHTTQDLRVGFTNDGVVTAIQQRAYSGMGPFLRRSGGLSGIDAYACPNVDRQIYPVHTNRTVSGNMRAPSEPQGFFPIQSLMDDVAYAVGMDPVDFALRNMRRPTEQVRFTNYSLEECIARGAELFDWRNRWRPTPGADAGPIKRGAGFAFMMFRSGVGPSSAILRLDGTTGRCTLFVGVTDIGPGAKTTMALIAAEELGASLDQVDVVWGDTDRCPYSVGESGSRTTIMTGYAVVEAARDLKRQIAERGTPGTSEVLIASATPNPSTQGRQRLCFGAHFCEVEVDVQLGHVRVTKFVAVHESGRILNPLPARDQIRGAVLQGISMALKEDLLYDARNGQPLTAGYYGARHLTHLDAPQIEVEFIETDDGFGPFGAKTVGEAGIIHSPTAVGNAIYNAIGRRMKDLPITRARILEALA